MQAQTLQHAIQIFDPRRPLAGQELADWYVERTGNPLQTMEILLNGPRLTGQPSKMLFTGHAGSGKSTALNKLAESLADQFFVVPVDVRELGGIASLTYVDLLLGMANALFRQVTERGVLRTAPAEHVERVWDDLVHFIENTIFGPASFRAPPAGAETSAKVNFLAGELQHKFASEATTRDAVRKRIEPRLAELHEQIDLVAGLVRTHDKRSVLFVVENTDKLDLSRARDIFVGHTYALTAFRASVIYTFPIGLRYSAPDFNLIRDHFTETYLLPNVRVATRDGSPDAAGLICLRKVIGQRMRDDLIEVEARERAIRASGGLMRTLILLVRRAAINALAAGQETISRANVEAAIDEERASFVAGLTRADYPALRDRHRDKQVSGDEDVLRLLQARALLGYANGEPWCDVHPIALPLVLERAPVHGV